MESNVSSSHILEALKVICHALNNQPGNEAEILQILVQLPSITSTYLPHDFKSQSEQQSVGGYTNESEEFRICDILESVLNTLVKWLTDHLKHVFHPEKQNDAPQLEMLQTGQILSICECVEYLKLLGGEDFMKEKIRGVLSRCVDHFLQHNMEYVAEILPNLKQVQENFTALVKDIKVIALDANRILFLCENLNLSPEKQMDLICDPILEKLSIELLTLVDSIKEGIKKQVPSSRSSVSSTNLFSNLTSMIEDIYLDRSELVSFAKIVDLFLGLEASLHDSEYTKLLKEKSKVDHCKKSSLKHGSQLPDLLRSSQQSSLIRSSQMYGQWNWQEILKDVGPIILKSISKVIDNCQTEETSTARNLYHMDDCCKLDAAPSVSSLLFPIGAGVPKKSITCFTETLKLMRDLLPFAVLGSQYKPLSGLHSQYVDECGQALKNMKSFLMTIIDDVPSKSPVSNLYFVLSTCEDICTILTYCSSKMHTETRVPFQGILQVYKDMNNMVRNVIIHHHSARLSTYILHDAESHHWSDPREFNEGESCSYSIQMWNLFLKQLWSELGSCVSEVQRHKIFTEVFGSSLHVLEQRYSQCLPSYNRSKQVTIDITSILTICRAFIFHTEFHPTRVFPADVPWSCLDVKQALSEIHSACQSLLLVLCVVTCPLEIFQKKICSTFSNDGNTASTRHGGTSNWLYYIHPTMFPPKWNGTLSGLLDKAAVYCAISFAEIHPSQSLVHCFYSLVMRKCFMLKKLMSSKVNLQSNEKDSEISLEQDIFVILSSCSFNFQDLFYKCSFKIMKQDIKSLLQACLQFSTEDLIFPWQNQFFSTLVPIVCMSLSKAGRYICNLTWSTMGSSLILSLPSSMKKQIINISESSSIEYADNCTLVSMILTIQGIVQCMYSLPDWLTTFLLSVKKDMKIIDHRDLLFNDAALHILVHCACYVLKSSNLWEDQHGIEFRRESLDFMQHTSDVFLEFCKGGKIPKGTQQIQDVVIQELENLKMASSTLFVDVSNDKHSNGMFDDQLLEECCRQVQIMKSEKAINSLRKIANVIVSNRRAIGRQWDLDTFLGKSQAEGMQNVRNGDIFDSIAEHDCIDVDPFDHYALANFPLNWDIMCSSLLSHDPDSVLHLLSHRWEMRGGLLQENEIEHVSKIKSAIASKRNSDAEQQN